MAIALVLAARPEGDPEVLTLEGRSSRNLPVTLRFVDGELRSADLKPSLRCPQFGGWESVVWEPRIGAYGEFHQDGPSFRVRHSYLAEPAPDTTPGRGTLVLAGELGDDQDSARGTINARWVTPGWTCRGTVRFRAG
jgi:hypothetical protein